MSSRNCKPDVRRPRECGGGSLLRRFFADARGATAIEYALLLTFIALVIIAGATQIGLETAGVFDRAADGFQ